MPNFERSIGYNLYGGGKPISWSESEGIPPQTSRPNLCETLKQHMSVGDTRAVITPAGEFWATLCSNGYNLRRIEPTELGQLQNPPIEIGF